MSVNPTPRYSRVNPSEPVMHDLPPLVAGEDTVPLRLVVRKADDSTWRGRLVFGPGAVEDAASTAEIFCATTEPDLWAAVRDLRDHHIRDLYRSLTGE